jgi:hypothetical protein
MRSPRLAAYGGGRRSAWVAPHMGTWSGCGRRDTPDRGTHRTELLARHPGRRHDHLLPDQRQASQRSTTVSTAAAPPGRRGGLRHPLHTSGTQCRNCADPDELLAWDEIQGKPKRPQGAVAPAVTIPANWGTAVTVRKQSVVPFKDGVIRLRQVGGVKDRGQASPGGDRSIR